MQVVYGPIIVSSVRKQRGRPRKGKGNKRLTGKAHTFYCAEEMIEQWKARFPNISARIRDYILADLAGKIDDSGFDLQEAKDELKDLADEDISLGKKLGGEKSDCYFALQKKVLELGLKVDYSNLDEILVALLEYVPTELDGFSSSALLLFSRKLEVMRDKKQLIAKILSESKRRLAEGISLSERSTIKKLPDPSEISKVEAKLSAKAAEASPNVLDEER
jgi:hypothetical protein